MRILKKTSQNRRDFEALLVCEHCEATQKVSGYDDTFYHTLVIPNIKCKACGKRASPDYQPNKPKYGEDVTI